MATALRQQEARRLEDTAAGRYRPAAPAALAQGDAAALGAEGERERRKQERLVAAVAGVAAEAPAAAPQLERVLAHAAAVDGR